MSEQKKVTGVILAGGLARRMQQQDKGLILFNNRPMVSYAINAMVQVADEVLINANRSQQEYQQLGYPVFADETQDFSGPLAGIYTAMIKTRSPVILVMPCDSPLMKASHLQKLLDTLEARDADIAVAFDGERLQPVFLALNTSLKDSLKDYLAQGQRKIDRWLQQHKLVKVDFSDNKEVFKNINTPEDLKALEELYS